MRSLAALGPNPAASPKRRIGVPSARVREKGEGVEEVAAERRSEEERAETGSGFAAEVFEELWDPGAEIQNGG
jgi:DNA-binding transcriptional regulator YdaS (Cro superfamily)